MMSIYGLGIEEGEKRKLIEMAQRKFRKGKSAELIAEELDEPLEHIEQIVAAIEECEPEADMADIYKQLMKYP